MKGCKGQGFRQGWKSNGRRAPRRASLTTSIMTRRDLRSWWPRSVELVATICRTSGHNLRVLHMDIWVGKGGKLTPTHLVISSSGN